MRTSAKRSAGLGRALSLAALLALGAAAAAVAGAPAGAGGHGTPALPDPTRPPAAAAALPAGTDPAPAAPQLQSVLLGPVPGEHRVAVIDGESVRVGESFRGARVVRIADNEVELRRGRERQVLRLDAPDGEAGMRRVARSGRRPDKGEQ